MEEIVLKELSRLNVHLPKKRVSLREAMSNPEVELVNGTKHRFRQEELRFLSSMVPEEMWDTIKLPILIELSPTLGKGAGRIRGPEARVIARLLGKRESEELIVYRPEISEIRKRLLTLTDYIFVP